MSDRPPDGPLQAKLGELKLLSRQLLLGAVSPRAFLDHALGPAFFGPPVTPSEPKPSTPKSVESESTPSEPKPPAPKPTAPKPSNSKPSASKPSALKAAKNTAPTSSAKDMSTLPPPAAAMPSALAGLLGLLPEERSALVAELSMELRLRGH